MSWLSLSYFLSCLPTKPKVDAVFRHATIVTGRFKELPWDRRGKRAEARGERGGTKKRERSEPPLKSRDSASLVFNKERCAKI